MTEKEKIRAEIEEVKLIIQANRAQGAFAEGYLLGQESVVEHLEKFIDSMHEEPVSEDLEKASKERLRSQLDKSYANYGEAKMMELTHFDGYAMLDAIEFGANWQKQQLMKNVVLETEVLRDSDGDGVDTPYESWLTLANTEISELPESLGLKEGDNVKVIIVKED